mmetsp:Transcript_20299/g.53013  ORF Transcript_20299/g.53013 Transcript_20299/m.53013 type:complete len:220 (-) Transcript_20299:32-691(-)
MFLFPFLANKSAPSATKSFTVSKFFMLSARCRGVFFSSSFELMRFECAAPMPRSSNIFTIRQFSFVSHALCRHVFLSSSFLVWSFVKRAPPSCAKTHSNKHMGAPLQASWSIVVPYAPFTSSLHPLSTIQSSIAIKVLVTLGEPVRQMPSKLSVPSNWCKSVHHKLCRFSLNTCCSLGWPLALINASTSKSWPKCHAFIMAWIGRFPSPSLEFKFAPSL